MSKRYLVTALLICACLVAAGCNTIHGMGKDIEKGGEAIQKSTK